MSAVRVLVIITLLLFAFGLGHPHDGSTHWLFEEKEEKTSEKRPTEWDPLPEEDVDKRAATKNVFHRKAFLYSTSLFYSVIEYRHSSVCLLKVCLRC